MTKSVPKIKQQSIIPKIQQKIQHYFKHFYSVNQNANFKISMYNSSSINISYLPEKIKKNL